MPWTTYTISVFFLLRLCLVWLSTYRIAVLPCLVDVWLFTQGTFTLFMGRGVSTHAFAFLALLRFVYWEWKNFTRPLSALKVLLCFAVFTVVVSAALQTAEEWNTTLGLHLNAHGELTPMRSLFEYTYMTMVTASTIGYGEMTPTTTPGRILVVCSQMVFLMVFATQSAVVANWVRNSIKNWLRLPPQTSQPRRVILINQGNTTHNELSAILKMTYGDR
ncbi:uncharacterized protein [Procambarus clarkii]|uniref:uncharacterized protein n=1 Tax=Procambarus clarkii TaxID=6728 RepID=UPI003742B06E